MVQFKIDNEDNMIMPCTSWALHEFINDDVIDIDEVYSNIPEGDHSQDTAVQIEKYCVNRWYGIMDGGHMLHQMKFINAEHTGDIV